MSCSLDQNKRFYKAMLTEGDFTAYCSYPELSWQLLVGEGMVALVKLCAALSAKS